MTPERMAELREQYKECKDGPVWECLDEIARIKKEPPHVWILYIFKNGGKIKEVRDVYVDYDKALEKKKYYQVHGEMCEVYPQMIL